MKPREVTGSYGRGHGKRRTRRVFDLPSGLAAWSTAPFQKENISDESKNVRSAAGGHSEVNSTQATQRTCRR